MVEYKLCLKEGDCEFKKPDKYGTHCELKESCEYQGATMYMRLEEIGRG
jgi:hypothetical protein